MITNLDHRTCVSSIPTCVQVTGTTEQPRKMMRVRHQTSDGEIHDIYYNHLCQVRQVDATLVTEMRPDWVNAWQVILNKILQLNFLEVEIKDDDYRI